MDLAFKSIINYVSKNAGVNLNGYRENYLKRRIEFRMKAVGVKNYVEYFRILRKDRDEIYKLLDAITINVTEFMRDKTPFYHFMRQILPNIAERKRKIGSKMIRIWSAGCSCGEEPYSIAICIYESLGNDWSPIIYATDIDEECLKRAEEGVYSVHQLKNLSEEIIKKYFNKMNNKLVIKPFLKKCIKFKKHDLITDKPVSRFFDVIFCRNVMIYFTKEQKIKVINDFYHALVKGGYLIIGKSETIPNEFKTKFMAIDLKEKIYMKI